jgi:branched-chain amino acid transport system substrate-binding protein
MACGGLWPGRALAAEGPVRVGVLVPLTGIAAQAGVEIRDGILMAKEEKGTLLGRPIELVVEDTQAKPEVGVRKAEKLVFQEGVKALAGVFSSAVGLAVAKHIDKLKVPFLTTHVMTTEFYGMHPLVFRCGQLANDQTAIGNVRGIMETPDLKKRRYYVLAHDYAWGHDAARRFVQLAKEKGIEVVNPKYDQAHLDTADWSSHLAKIKASGADGLYLALITTVIPVFTRQAAELGVLANCLIVSGAAPGVTELEAAGDNGLGIFGASCYAWDLERISPKALEWDRRYFARFQAVPSDAAAHSYVGAMILFNGIEAAGALEAGRIAEGVRKQSLEGPYGKVHIAGRDNCARNGAVLTETLPAPPNPYGAKVYMKVLKFYKPEELGPPW